MISRGSEIDTATLADQWDAKERSLFDALDAGGVSVTGYRPGARIYEELPTGLWARMNKGGDSDPRFSPIDGSEERENGGTVEIGQRTWEGVRLPMSFVLEHWPPHREEAKINRGVPRRRGTGLRLR